MFTENNKTIFDDVKAFKVVNASIPEDKIYDDAKAFKITKDTNLHFNEIDDNKHSPSFHFRLDNDLIDFFGYPDISLSSNPEYMNKYPKLTKQEYSIANWQTEEGVSNKLNRFLRQNETNNSIEDIEQFDNAYQADIKTLNLLKAAWTGNSELIQIGLGRKSRCKSKGAAHGRTRRCRAETGSEEDEATASNAEEDSDAGGGGGVEGGRNESRARPVLRPRRSEQPRPGGDSGQRDESPGESCQAMWGTARTAMEHYIFLCGYRRL